MKMKTTLSLVASAAVALLSFGAMAQDQPKSRADVKAETAAANKSGQIATGEETAKTPKPKSTANRSDVKTETKAANKAGTIPTGDEPATKK